MAKRFDETEKERCIKFINSCSDSSMSLRKMAAHLGVSRSYIHRLTGEMGVSFYDMKHASKRRKNFGWEPLPSGSAISCDAIGIPPHENERNEFTSMFSSRMIFLSL
ncbi:MAG: hypothetical protein SOH81_11710 [Acetobacter sp.]|jgi:DNA-binding MurR/RpiR family transcriptional regulator